MAEILHYQFGKKPQQALTKLYQLPVTLELFERTLKIIIYGFNSIKKF